jgi:5-methylcytosine-specific restriction endonuclease McrA
MNKTRCREPNDYRELRRKVLKRDGWRCQYCGSMQNLQVHHRQFRNQLGADEEDNLITLCKGCHVTIRGLSTD